MIPPATEDLGDYLPRPMLAAIAYAAAIANEDEDLAAAIRRSLGDDTLLLDELASLLANFMTQRDPTTQDRGRACERWLHYAAGLIPPPDRLETEA